MKIYSPNKDYTGVSASVSFCSGVGETDDPYLLGWFRSHGYKVEEPEHKDEVGEPDEKKTGSPGKKDPEKKAGE